MDPGPNVRDPSRPRIEGGASLPQIVAMVVLCAIAQALLFWAMSGQVRTADDTELWLWASSAVSLIGLAITARPRRDERGLRAPSPEAMLGALAIAAPAAWPLIAGEGLAMQRAEGSLAVWLGSEELAEIEHAQGFSRRATFDHPQVSRPAGFESLRWVAREVDVPQDFERVLAPEAHGAIVLVNDDGTLAVDRGHVHLGARMADAEADIAWIAFVRRSWPVSYSYDDGSDILAERADVRIVDRASGELLARVSIGAIPSERVEHGPEHEDVPGYALGEAVAQAVNAVGLEPPPDDPPWHAGGCEIADRFLDEEPESSDQCLEGATEECERACRRGSLAACRDAGYTLDHGSPRRALPYYALACRAGSANACTNFAAALQADDQTDPEALACARSVFERTCAHDDYWGCMMLGSMLSSGRGGPEDDARAREVLESSCDRGRPQSCLFLGSGLWRDRFGAPDRVAARTFLERVCPLEPGDVACRQAQESLEELAAEALAADAQP